MKLINKILSIIVRNKFKKNLIYIFYLVIYFIHFLLFYFIFYSYILYLIIDR